MNTKVRAGRTGAKGCECNPGRDVKISPGSTGAKGCECNSGRDVKISPGSTGAIGHECKYDRYLGDVFLPARNLKASAVPIPINRSEAEIGAALTTVNEKNKKVRAAGTGATGHEYIADKNGKQEYLNNNVFCSTDFKNSIEIKISAVYSKKAMPSEYGANSTLRLCGTCTKVQVRYG